MLDDQVKGDPNDQADSAGDHSPLSAEPSNPQRQIELGFMFCHSVVSENAQHLVETAATAYAWSELLLEKGIIEAAEYEERRQKIYDSLIRQVEQSGLGLYLNEEHTDKYALTDLPVIDCVERIHLCRAVCCTLHFPLSRQDVEQGVVRWDLGRPYINLRSETGYCVHLAAGNNHCQIYDHRPAPCRLYSCREDERIWLDFEARIINPELEAAFTQPMNPSLE